MILANILALCASAITIAPVPMVTDIESGCGLTSHIQLLSSLPVVLSCGLGLAVLIRCIKGL